MCAQKVLLSVWIVVAVLAAASLGCIGVGFSLYRTPRTPFEILFALTYFVVLLLWVSPLACGVGLLAMGAFNGFYRRVFVALVHPASREPLRNPSSDGAACPSCGYDLSGNVSGRCPECGTRVGTRNRRRRDRFWLAVAAVNLAALPVGYALAVLADMLRRAAN